MGIDDEHRIYRAEELARGDVMFAATGVTTSDFLKGVRYFGGGARTIGVFFEKPGAETKTGSAGWYNTVAFETAAARDGLYARSFNGDAFSNEMKQAVIEAIAKDLGTVDLVVGAKRGGAGIGRAYLLLGGSAWSSLEDAAATVDAGEFGGSCGWSTDASGDLDGDGAADWAVGDGLGLGERGRVGVFLTAPSGAADLVDADLVWTGGVGARLRTFAAAGGGSVPACVPRHQPC
jgi:hypothetical protein